MKHGKRPTVAQKKILSDRGLNHENWLIVKHTTEYMMIEHRISRQVRTITIKDDKE